MHPEPCIFKNFQSRLQQQWTPLQDTRALRVNGVRWSVTGSHHAQGASLMVKDVVNQKSYGIHTDRGSNTAMMSQRVHQLEQSLEAIKNTVLATNRELATESTSRESNRPQTLEIPTGMLIVENEKSRYISGSLWAKLTDEVILSSLF